MNTCFLSIHRNNRFGHIWRCRAAWWDCCDTEGQHSISQLMLFYGLQKLCKKTSACSQSFMLFYEEFRADSMPPSYAVIKCVYMGSLRMERRSAPLWRDRKCNSGGFSEPDAVRNIFPLYHLPYGIRRYNRTEFGLNSMAPQTFTISLNA